MYSLQKLSEIFFSGTHSFVGSMAELQEVASCINEGYLKVSTVRIASKDEYLFTSESAAINPSQFDEAAGGSASHIALKVLAKKYFESRGKECIFEQSFCGYFPDDLSTDRKSIAECGNTQNPAKILDYFRLGRIDTCVQIPYPDDSEPVALGYELSASSELYNFLDFLSSEKNCDIKRILKERPRFTS